MLEVFLLNDNYIYRMLPTFISFVPYLSPQWESKAVYVVLFLFS